MQSKFVATILVATLAIAIVACSSSTETEPGEATAPPPTPTLAPSPYIAPSPTVTSTPTAKPEPTVEQVLSISAIELYSERESNATRYDQTYKGKRVRINGLVGKVDGGQISLVVDHSTFSLLDTTLLASIELHDLPVRDQIKANKGEGFEAVCTVGNYILGSIQLRDCSNGEVVEIEMEPALGSSTSGILIVGKDIEPGLYKAEVAAGLIPLCYWARLSDTDGEFSSIIANDTVTEGTVYVTIKRSDAAFESSGCTNWELQDDTEVEVATNQQVPQESTPIPTPVEAVVPEVQAESAGTPVPNETPTPEIEIRQDVESESSVSPTDTPTPEDEPALPIPPEPTETPVLTATATPEVETTPTAEPVHLSIGLGPGIYLVGSDIQSGRYKAEVASGSFGCSWSRLSDTDGELSSVIAISVIQKGQTYVTIKPTDVAFETNGCTDFVLQTADELSAVQGVEEFGPGTYLVGHEIQPGRYKAEVTSGSFGCSWSRLSDTDGELSSVIAISVIQEGQTYVTIKPTDVAFETSGCTDFVLHTNDSSKSDIGLTEFGPGTYLVQSEIQPGRYKAEVAPDSFGCSWSRLSETDGELSSVIAIDVILEGQTYVTIEESDFAFETSGCTNWESQ